MTATYRAVHWNRQKKLYDAVLAVGVVTSIALYVTVSLITNPNITIETLIIRATSTAAFILLHIILCIGPLCRIDTRFLPLLYNRRHLGIAMFLLAAIHAGMSVIQFHAFGDLNPLVSIFTAYQQDYALTNGISQFPFEPFGFFALAILFIMAATSHDFWLRNLGASFWKTLHILVYAAYGLLVLHVAFGALQSERSPIYPALLGLGMLTVIGLHLIAFAKERKLDTKSTPPADDDYHLVCAVNELTEGRGHVAILSDDRVALYRIQHRIYALSNACRHQAGPIGEGCLVDGLVTCPWHGWNYHPQDGVSPPPFEKECIATYPVRVHDGQVYVHSKPNPLRTKCEGASESGGESKIVRESVETQEAK